MTSTTDAAVERVTAYPNDHHLLASDLRALIAAARAAQA